MQHRYLKNVTTLALSAEQCVGCGMCAEVCPHGVFAIDDCKAQIKDKDLCMECGACARNCPASAISVDAGAGCAYAVMLDWLAGGEPRGDCSGGECC